MEKGWIKLHRKFIKWGWYQKSEMVHLFLHLLLSTNHENNEWQGVKIKRGQVITGRKQLKRDTGLSEQTIRTCLERLKSTNEITTKPTSKFTLITIVNWEDYQDRDKISTSKSTKRLTNNQPTTNQRLTTNKNDNKVKNDKKKVEKINFTSKDMKMVDLLIGLIQQNNPEWKMRGNKDNWAEHINKIHRIDERTYEQIEFMIKWVQQDSFWSQNILSTSKLREKFNDLIPRIKKSSFQGTKKQIFI